MLYENSIEFRQSPAGKMRRYFSFLNIIDLFKTAYGMVRSLILVFHIYPDVVFSKGGYASVPTVFAARVLRIPVVIHESDASPGRANTWAGKFAARIAISYPEAASHFPAEKTALVGNPVRRALRSVAHDGAHEFLKLSPETPTVLIIGGSQGAAILNDTVLGALPELLTKYQVIHQTGATLFEEVSKTAGVILENHEHTDRYKPFAYLNDLALRMAAGASAVIISRAGSGAIFELALWGIPAILVPIPTDISHDQTRNAFTYARAGAAVVIEQHNLSPHLLVSEIDRLVGRPEVREAMTSAAHAFSKPDAARHLAEGLLAIAMRHEIT
jgi:UDP-N-acetylglucosamine--N-acetylmuramyl-(pentapeptide) pyrophosphoryl-undecaprenol N-acetylglucosamine transferase